MAMVVVDDSCLQADSQPKSGGLVWGSTADDGLSVLTTIFPGEPELAGFTETKDDGGGGDNWSYKTCKAPVKLSPSTNQHPLFYRPDALPVAQTTVSEHCSCVKTVNYTLCLKKSVPLSFSG